MYYQIKQNLISFARFAVNDQKGEPVYIAKGKFLSFGHNLSLQTPDRVEVAQIRQRIMSWWPKFDIFIGDKQFATISRQFSWFRNKFLLDVPGPDDYSVNGNFLEYEYEFERKNRVVATVSRKFWALGESYGVNIDKDEDHLSILSTVIVLSLCRQYQHAAA